MTIFKYHTSCLLASLVAFSTPGLNAASVELNNGDTLSGNITSFDSETLTLSSSVSYEPLQINSNAVKRILINEKPKETEVHNERLTLLNGDTIPCEVLSLDDKQLNISTWYAGDFSIARNQLQNIQFGVSDQRVIYRGNDEITQWTTRQGSWTKSDDHNISSRGSGVLAREFELPKNLRISYTLGWKGNPNFVFRFCGENKSATTKQDTYEFTFNSAGMQIRRYAENNNTGAALANIPLKPSNYSAQSVNLDFHVNRDVGSITLFVDGIKIDSWPDQFEISTGNYIIFNNRSSKNQITLKNIQITDLNDGSLPRHREPIEKSKSDIFLDSMGDVYSGTILSINKKEDNKRIMRIKKDTASKPFEVPEDKISSLGFSQSDKASDLAQSDFVAMFQNNNHIQLSSPKFTDGFLEATHPILGKCKIDLKAISQLKKNAAKKEEDE